NDQVTTERRVISSSLPIRPDLTILFFGDHGATFVPLAHLGMQDGARLGPRVDNFEAWAAHGYAEHPHPVDDPHQGAEGLWRDEARRRAPPGFIQVVTLRRMEIARRRDPTGDAPDWQWQWSVIGHW